MFGGRRRRREEELVAKDRWRTARKLMDEDVTVLGEQVAELHVDTLGDALDSEAADHYRRALESYDQAKSLLAASETVEDVLAIEQVVADARYHRAAVIAIRDGAPLPERREPCFFNPQHGPSMQDVAWTPPGGTARTIAICAADARRLAAGEEPLVRMVRVGDRWVPWHESGNLRHLADAGSGIAGGGYGAEVQRGMAQAYLNQALGGNDGTADAARQVPRHPAVADAHHPHERLVAGGQCARVGCTHWDAALNAAGRGPLDVLPRGAVLGVEEAGLASLGERVTGDDCDDGGAVVAGVGDDLLDPEHVLDGLAGGQQLLGLVVVLQGPPVVVAGGRVEVVGEGVDVELGDLLAEHGHVLVHQLARDPPAVQCNERLFTASSPSPEHARSLARAGHRRTPSAGEVRRTPVRSVVLFVDLSGESHSCCVPALPASCSRLSRARCCCPCCRRPRPRVRSRARGSRRGRPPGAPRSR